MTGALAPAVAVDRPSRVPVEPRLEERWFFSRPSDRRPATILAVSFGLHALVVGTVLVSGRPPEPKVSREISVEIVQEAPKPPPSKPTSKPEVAKPKSPEPDPPKAAPPPKPEAQVAPQQARPNPPSQPVDPTSKELADLQKQLAELKAEHAALEAATAPAPAVGAGSLAASIPAIALPGTGTGDGEAVGYRDLVFSQLAKAKGLGQIQGQAGTSGVRFEIDAAGALVSVDIAVPSGIASLDKMALDIVRRAAPFPPPPKGADRQFFANVTFTPQAKP